MANAPDRENVAKAAQAANLLVQDLRGVMRSADPLLVEVSMEILKTAVEIERRLNRIEAIMPR